MAGVSPRKQFVADRIRLYFAEPIEQTHLGERAFNVAIQGTPVLSNWEIRTEAKDSGKTIVKEFRDIAIQNDLAVTFQPAESSTGGLPIVSGIEIIAENASTPIANWGWY